jgi:small subunit ribosomal protein S16
MAVAIRLRRGGRTHSPYYRMVVVDSRVRRDGRVIEEIGLYHPVAKPEPRTEIDVRKALGWLHKGAQPSNTVRNLFSKQGIMAQFNDGVKPEDIVEATPSEEAAAETAAEAPAETPAETGESPAAKVHEGE